jgi:hypothetical protein
LRHFLVGKQFVRLAGQARKHFLHQAFDAGVAKVAQGVLKVLILERHAIILIGKCRFGQEGLGWISVRK